LSAILILFFLSAIRILFFLLAARAGPSVSAFYPNLVAGSLEPHISHEFAEYRCQTSMSGRLDQL
jgi:hypothetical protein